MRQTPERRNWERTELDPPLIGIARLNHPDRPDDGLRFTGIRNLSKRGIMVDSLEPFPQDTIAEFQFCMHQSGEWQSYQFRPIWSSRAPGGDLYRTGFDFDSSKQASWCPAIRSAEVKFLQSTDLLSAVSMEGILDLLGRLTRVRIEPGAILFSQGDEGDALYIVQEGTCLVLVRQDGRTSRINRMAAGDIIGEMALVTGEPRSATIEAETELCLWKMEKTDFEAAVSRHPDLLSFLTEIVARRFETSPVTADRRVGKYLIKEKIGTGGWSIVYRGVHELLGLPVAVKMLKHDMAMVPGFRDKFRSEANTIALLNHPRIVRVYDIEELYRTVFIIMEYLDGKSLRSLLQSCGPLPIPRVLDYLAQTLSGLEYAHTQGIVHQDIKPENIYIQPGDKIKIMDFGLACAPESDVLGFTGTIFYAPPEQIEHGQVTERSDIYSLGLMAFEMLTGRRPYPEIDPIRVLDLHVNEDIPDPGVFNPNIPNRLKRIVFKACSRDPEQRYPSARAMYKDLMEVPGSPSASQHPTSETRDKMTSLLLRYPAERQQELQHLLNEFSRKAREMGMDVMAAEYHGME